MLEHELQTIYTTLTSADAFKYWAIPFVAAIVGWGTNWVAIQMTFWPIEYRGVRPFGWQGVVPSHIEKMATIAISSMISKLSTLYELFQAMEPEALAEHLKARSADHLEELIDEAMVEHNALLWENLPNFIKHRIYNYARKTVPGLIERAVADVAEHIEELVDIKLMIIDQLVKDKALMNRAFLEVGHKELKFLVRSGFYFGFPFGVIQMLVWILNPEVWVLPLFGLLVGYATNWLALNMIFRPLYPVKIGPFIIQGLFIKRQAEIARTFCTLVSQEVLTIGRLVSSMIHGPRRVQSRALLRKHLRPVMDAPVLKTLTQVLAGPQEYVEIKKIIEKKSLDAAEFFFTDAQFNQDRAKTLENLYTDRLAAMPPEKFQDLLRPAFQEDEWILIMIGAILGMFAGLGQLIFVFA